MRSRSFLFFALGAAVADACGVDSPIVVAENGLITLNTPLTPSRVGSCSTRTTHPHYVNSLNDTFASLSLPLQFHLPYMFKTKGEMLAECRDRPTLTRTAKLSMSCSHPERSRFVGLPPSTHCGYCVPCIIRRAAMKKARLTDGTYGEDITLGRSDLRPDVRAFQMALERIRVSTPLERAAEVVSTGPLVAADIEGHANTYFRGMQEVGKLFGLRI